MHPKQSSARAGGVVEDAKAAAQHGAPEHLIGEAEPWRKQLPLRLNAHVPAGVKPGNHDLARQIIEIHHAIGDFDRRRQKLITQTDVEREAAGHAPIVGDVRANFEHTVAGPDQLQVLRQRTVGAEQEPRHAVTGSRGAVGIGSEVGIEVEEAVALVHLEIGNLAAHQAGAEFQRVIAADVGEIDQRVERIFQADGGNRCRAADAGVAAQREDRHPVRLRQLIRKRYAQLRAQSGAAGRRLRVQVVHVKA